MALMENWEQVSFRYRNDDGSESGATWRVAANTNDTLSVDTTYRMRFLVAGNHTGGSGSFGIAAQFQYNLASGGWNDITTTSSVVKAVASADTSWTINDDDNTTEQMAGPDTFVAGKMDETGSTSSVTVSDTEETEFELVFQIVSADVTDAQTVEIRVTNGGTALDTYTQTPSITISDPAGSTIPVPVGSAATSGLAPSLLLNVIRDVPAGSASFTGYEPQRGAGLRLIGYAPTIDISPVSGDKTIPVPVGAATLSGLAPTLDTKIAVAAGSIAATGFAPQAIENIIVSVPAGSASFTGYAVSLDLTIAVGAGSATFSGLAPSLDTVIGVPAGAISVTGYAPEVLETILVSVPAGSASFTGYAVSLDLGIGVPAGSASFSGLTPTLDLTIGIPAGSASFTGYAPTLSHTIAIPAGSVTAQGLAPSLDLTIAVPAGSATFTGYAPFVPGDNTIEVPVGSVTSQGYAVTLDTTIGLPAGAGTFSGLTPNLITNYIRSVPAGSALFNGLAVTLDTSLGMPPASISAAGYAPQVVVTSSGTITVPVGSAAFSGLAATAINTSPVASKGGRTSRGRKYSVEVDGEFFVFGTIAEVQEFLADVRGAAEIAAERDVTSHAKPKTPKVAVRLVSGRQTQSKTIRAEVKKTQSVVNKAYIRAAQKAAAMREVDKEISRLIQNKLRDEEDKIIALLL